MYNRFIVSGNTLETFQYERSPNRNQKKRGKRGFSRRDDLSDLVVDRGITASSEMATEGFKERRKSNSRRAKMAFRRLVLCNLGKPPFPLLVTFTYSENQTDLRIAYKNFDSFIKSFRYKFGGAFRFIAVPEFQKRGAVHFHALFWCLPESVYKLERSTRMVASIWGRGFVFIKQTNGNERLAGYLSKYMVKSFTDPRLFSHRCYTSSRNVFRPIDVGTEVPLSLSFEAMKLSPGEALLVKSFDTQYMGRAIYKRYKLD